MQVAQAYALVVQMSLIRSLTHRKMHSRCIAELFQKPHCRNGPAFSNVKRLGVPFLFNGILHKLKILA